MRLKLLTNLNTLLLVAVCVALGATLWWSQKALERPYLLMERYLGLSATTRFTQHLPFINAHVRTISRVVVHPQFRGAGVATRLIRRMLDECPTRYVEAQAVMARVHPMFDAAGMKRIDPPTGDERRPVYFIFDKEGSPCDSDVTK